MMLQLSATRILFATLGTLFVLLSACVGGEERKRSLPIQTARGTSSPEPMIAWSALRRPIRLPRLGVGIRCPKTEGTPARELTRDVSPQLYPLGEGPVRPVLAGPIGYGPGALRGPNAVVHYVHQPHTKWSAIKTLWIAPPRYRGRVLVRGRQLDGQHGVRFGSRKLHKELHLNTLGGSMPSGWQNWTSATRLIAPGCYGLQLDSAHNSRVIIFPAEPYAGP